MYYKNMTNFEVFHGENFIKHKRFISEDRVCDIL